MLNTLKKNLTSKKCRNLIFGISSYQLHIMIYFSHVLHWEFTIYLHSHANLLISTEFIAINSLTYKTYTNDSKRYPPIIHIITFRCYKRRVKIPRLMNFFARLHSYYARFVMKRSPTSSRRHQSITRRRRAID